MAKPKIFVLMLVIYITTFRAAVCSNATHPRDIDGLKLLELGQRTNNTLITLFGQALTNVQCRTPLCGQWSPWSECRTVFGQFGMMERTKLCGVYESRCELPVRNVTETDTKFCKLFWCPSNYTYTRHGFCLRYNSTKMTWNDAKNSCDVDGGHLVNIDSAEKAEDIDFIFNIYAKYSWIDGIKRESGGIWEYLTKSENPGFTDWRKGQPDSSTFPVCKLIYDYGGSTRWQWIDNSCTVKFPFLCEL